MTSTPPEPLTLPPDFVPDSGIDVRAALDAVLLQRPFMAAHGGLFSSSLTVDTSNMTGRQVEDVLAWFKDHGGRVEVDESYSKEGRARHNTHKRIVWAAVVREGKWYAKVYLAGETEKIGRPRPKRPVHWMERALGSMVKESFDRHARQKRFEQEARGRTCFYEDGSLLKRAVEVLGEPVPEPKR